MRSAIAVFLTIVVVFAGSALATSDWKSDFNGQYGTNGTKLNSCSTCHTSAPALNPYGDDLKTKFDLGNNEVQSMLLIEDDDSDDDGATNIVEILNRTFPGDPNDTVPVRGATWSVIKSLYQ